MKTILLSGSNGFIGKYIKEYGKFQDYKILYGTTSQLENEQYIRFSSFYSNMKSVLINQKIDIIIHCASIIPNTFNTSTRELFFGNIEMMTNLYEFSIEQKVEKFIYLSSFGSMQNPKEYDIKDYYTLSKVTGEHICSIMESKGIETASLRVSSPFGEFYNKKNVLSIFVDMALQNKTIQVYGSGNREQNFIYAGNILEYIYCCLKHNITGVYDVVSKNNISMNELAKTIIKLANSESKIELGSYDDPLENIKLPIYNYEKSKEISYKDKYSFESYLMQYINYKRELL